METVEQAAFEPMASLGDEWDFVVRVPKANLRGGKGGKLVAGVTKYKDFPFPERARCHEGWCRDHVFVLDMDGGPGWHEFWFTQDRTGDLLRQPIKSRTLHTTKPHRWDDVILRMGFIEDPNMPMRFQVGDSTVSVPRLFGRYWRLPGGVYASKMKVETFVSPRDFDPSLFQLDIPVPTTVTWDMRNVNGSVTCLHPEIRFTETQTAGRVLQGAGTVGKPIVMQGVQVFPATNHPQWITHVCDEDATVERGVFQLVRTTVEPPGVRRIRNAA